MRTRSLLLADADKVGAEISPLTGLEVKQIVGEVIDTPAHVKAAFGRAAKF